MAGARPRQAFREGPKTTLWVRESESRRVAVVGDGDEGDGLVVVVDDVDES